MHAKKTTTRIEGPSGALEVRVCEPQSIPNQWAVISHPHPQFGGTMDNKVVTTLERAFQARGIGTVTYNFRGVGQSVGAYDGGEGEQGDLAAVVAWARAQFAPQRLILAGFSFGAYVSLMAQPQLQADELWMVAPPVGLYDFTAVPPVTVPWSVVIGLEDEVVNVDEMLDWVLAQSPRPNLLCRAGASHFLHGQLVWLKQMVAAAG
jgi:hypothetical protein